MDEHLLLVIPALVLLTGLWRPPVGLVVFAASLPLFGAPPAGPYLGALDLAGLSALIVALRARPENTAHRGVSRNCLWWPLAAWITVTVVSLLPPVYRPPSWQPEVLLSLVRSLPYTDALSPVFTLTMAQRSLLALALFWAYRRVFRDRSIRPIGLGLAMGAGYIVVLGLLEYIGRLDLSGYRAIGAELYAFRLHSLFFHSGWLAEYLILAVPFGLAAVYSGGTRVWYVAGHTLFGLAAVALLLTQQRGAWLAAIAQVTFALLFVGATRIRRRHLIGALLTTVLSSMLILATVSLSQPQVVESLQTRLGSAGGDLSGRLAVWQRSLEIAKEAKFLGSGLGTFAATYEEAYPCGTHKFCWLTAHSLYVHTVVERGGLGLLALLTLGWAVATCVMSLVRSGHGREGPGETGTLAVGLTVSLVGAAVYGLVQYIFFLQNIEWLCWILLAAVSLVGCGEPSPTVRRLAQALVVLALISLPLRWLTAAPSADGAREYGFHRAEHLADGRVVNWTSPEAARRIPWEGETLLVELIDGHPRGAARALQVTLAVDGIELWSGPVGSEWTEAVLEVGMPRREWLTLQIEARPSFRPYWDSRRHPELKPSRDIRSLGVVVGETNWTRFFLQNRRVTGHESVRSEHFPIRAGNLGSGDYVVGATSSVEIVAPSVILENGFRVVGNLTVGSPVPGD